MERKIQANVLGIEEHLFDQLEADAEANGRTVEEEITAIVECRAKVRLAAAASLKPISRHNPECANPVNN